MKFLSLVVVMAAAFVSCTNSTKEAKQKTFDSGAVFYDYKVWGDEGNDSITVLLQYRFGNEEDLPAALRSGSKVTFDGKEISPDSARLTGTFYEVVLPAVEFKGNHTVLFNGSDGETHRQDFSFLPFALASELPAEVKMEPLVIKLKGFGKEPARVQLVMIDTAFDSKDVNEDILVMNGELTITTKMWRALRAGPITMEIYREQKTPIAKGINEAGKLVMTYKLKREFEAVKN